MYKRTLFDDDISHLGNRQLPRDTLAVFALRPGLGKFIIQTEKGAVISGRRLQHAHSLNVIRPAWEGSHTTQQSRSSTRGSPSRVTLLSCGRLPGFSSRSRTRGLFQLLPSGSTFNPIRQHGLRRRLHDYRLYLRHFANVARARMSKQAWINNAMHPPYGPRLLLSNSINSDRVRSRGTDILGPA